MKRLITVLLSFLLAASLLPALPAQADFKDVPADDAKLIEATRLLSELGIVKGYEDGTLQPEKKISRAEMTKMLVSARGYGGTANGTPTFSDCQKHWAKGYIALANDLGIIEGIGNNKFDPDAKVTYEQATAMLLRTLGFSNENLNGGASATYNAEAYEKQAVSVGLYSGLDVSDMQAEVSRGEAAIMVSTGLRCETVTTSENGLPLGGGLILMETLASADSFTVTVEELSKGHRVNLTNYLYENIRVYQQDGKVIDVSGSNVKTYTGNPTVNKNTAAGVITVTMADATRKDLILSAAQIPVFYNGAEEYMTEAQLEALDCDAKFVLNTDGKLVGAVCEKYASPVQVSKTYVSGKAIFSGYTLPMDNASNVDFGRITVTGDAAKLSDIKVDDIIECAQALDKSRITIVVTRKSFTGKVTKLSGDKCYIASTAYLLNGAVVALGDEGSFFLDRKGSIAAFRAKNSEYTYGIITRLANGSVSRDAAGRLSVAAYPKVMLVTTDGKVRILEAAVVLDGDKLSIADGLTAAISGSSISVSFARKYAQAFHSEHCLVRYALDAYGRVSGIEYVDVVAAEMKPTDSGFRAGASTVVLNYSGGNYEAVSPSRLPDSQLSLVHTADWALVIVNDTQLAEPALCGIITGWNYVQESGSGVLEVTALVDGFEETYRAAAGKYFGNLAVYQNRIVEFGLDENNALTSVSPYSKPVYYGKANKVYGTYLTMNGRQLYFSEDCVVYCCDERGKVSVGDMGDVQRAENQTYMDVYILVGGQIGYIVINPQHYVEPYVEPVTTHYGLLLGMEGRSLVFASAGEAPTILTYTGQGFELPNRGAQVVKYTMQSGSVTSVTGLEKISGLQISLDEAQKLLYGTGTQGTDARYYLQSSVLVYENQQLIDFTTTLEGKTADFYLDGGTVAAIVVHTEVEPT